MNFDKQIKIWIEQGKLKLQTPHLDQIKALIERAQKDIKIAEINIDIDYDTAFSVAYNAMLKAGRALILHKGYRTDDGSQHKTTVDFCSYLLDDETKNLVKQFDRMRRIRNIISYDPFDYAGFSKEDVLTAISNSKNFVQAIIKLVTIQ